MTSTATTENPLWLRHPVVALAARWLPILLCSLIAFAESIRRLLPGNTTGQQVGYLVLVPVLVLVTSLGIARRRHRELPIHDRQVDYIVAGMAMGLAISIVGLLVPRYPDHFDLVRLDMYAVIAFNFGACVLVFGLRATGRFWPLWLLLLGLGPLPYRTAVVLLGGGWHAVALVSVLFVGLATGIAVARNWRRGLLGVAVAVAFGTALVVLLDLLTDGTPPQLLQQVPAIAAAVTVGGYFIWYSVRYREPNSALIPRRKPTVDHPWPAMITLVAVTAVLWLLPLPPAIDLRIGSGPPPPTTPGVAVPDGWTQTGFARFTWAPEYYGPDATLVRQVLTADRVVPEWDTKGRRRIVVVDTLRTYVPFTLQTYPGPALYSSVRARRSDQLYLELAPGVTARAYTIVDENLFLTWTNLIFYWHRGDRLVESIRIIAVDNHDPGAPFPEPNPNLGSVAARMFTVLLRGNAIAVDDKPEYKDLDLLTTLGREIVDRQRAEQP